MTKQDLILMMGNEDKANWAMDKILENIKPDFLIAILRHIKNDAETRYKERCESGYYDEFSTFPPDFNLFSVEDDSPLSRQYVNDARRQIEKAGDRASVNFARNVYSHAINNKP